MTMIAARISSARGHYNAPVNQICGTTGQAGRLAGPRLQIDDGAAIKAVGRTDADEGSRVATRCATFVPVSLTQPAARIAVASASRTNLHTKRVCGSTGRRRGGGAR